MLFSQRATKLSCFAPVMLLSCLSLLSACGGGEDPIEWTPNGGLTPPPAGMGAPPSDMRPPVEPADMGPTGGALVGGVEVEDMGTPVEPTEPYEVCEVNADRALLASEIGPKIVQSCSGRGCHSPTDTFTSFYVSASVAGSSGPLDEAQTESLWSTLEPFLSFEEPTSSSLLTDANSPTHAAVQGYTPGAAQYQQLIDWMTNAYQCMWVYPDPPTTGGEMAGEMAGEIAGEIAGEMMPPNGGTSNPTEVFCAALPSGDPQGRPNFYETFEARINGILASSCASSGCHDQPYPDYGFWVVNVDDPCSVQANFLMSQLYVNFNEPLRSPLLVRPLEPNHGGYRVLTQADPEYTELRQWIVSGVQN
jgi:hypothetical protein